MNIAVRQRAGNHSIQVVRIRIGEPARAVLSPQPIERLVTDDTRAYSGDVAPWNVLCQVHFLWRATALLTEERGLMGMAERESVFGEFGGVLAHLRTSGPPPLLDWPLVNKP